MIFYVSEEKVFDKQQQDYTWDTENAGNDRTQPADRELKPDKPAEEIEHEKHDKAKQRVKEQLESPFYRSRKDFNNKPKQQNSDNNINNGLENIHFASY